MLRKLFQALTLGSLLLCTLSAWLWVQSGTHAQQLIVQPGGGETIRFCTYQSQFMLSRSIFPAAQGPGGGQLSWVSAARKPANIIDEPPVMTMGFAFSHHSIDPNKGAETILIVPAWAATAVLALLPAWWIAKRIKPRSKKKPATV